MESKDVLRNSLGKDKEDSHSDEISASNDYAPSIIDAPKACTSDEVNLENYSLQDKDILISVKNSIKFESSLLDQPVSQSNETFFFESSTNGFENTHSEVQDETNGGMKKSFSTSILGHLESKKEE